MKDHEIIELYWARNESAITATTEKYGNYCHKDKVITLGDVSVTVERE